MAGLLAEDTTAPADWSEPERRLWEAYRHGEWLVLDEEGNGDNDPARADEWGAHRTVRGEVLEQLLRHGPEAHPGHTARLRLVGARITGRLDLSDSRVDAPIALLSCSFEQPVILNGAELNTFSLDESHLPGLDATQVRITRNLMLARAVVTGEIRLLGARIGGQLTLSGARLTNEHDNVLILDNAVVDGGVFAGDSVITGQVRLPNARITGDLFLSGAHLTNEHDAVLLLDRAVVEGSLFAGDGLTASGQVRLPGAHVTGHLLLSGARLTNEHDDALILDNAVVDGGVFAGDSVITGQVRLPGTHIGDDLNLTGAHLTNPEGNALFLDGATIGGDLILGNGFTAAGEVRLLGARIGGDFALVGAHLSNENGTALGLDRATVDGDLIARDGFTTTGQVSLLGAHIGGVFSLSGARLTNKDGYVLCMDRTVTGGGLFADEGFTAAGEFCLLGARIGGQFVLSGARLTNPGGTALAMDGALVEGDLFADNLVVSGEVRLPGTRINGDLDLGDAQLVHSGGDALNLVEARASRLILLLHPESAGLVNLRDAQVGRFVDDPRRWPPECRIDLDGFRYERLSQLPGDTSPACPIKERLAWMRTYTVTTQPPGAAAEGRTEFSPTPYEQLATALRRDGQERQARQVSRHREHLYHRSLGPVGRLWGAIQRRTVGYGYQPALALAWVIGMLLFGTLYFTAAGPLTPIKADEHPTWSPFFYTLDLLVPLLDLGHEKAWDPVGADRWAALLLMAAGWVLVTSFAAGAGRVLRRP